MMTNEELSAVVADYGTPAFVFDAGALERRIAACRDIVGETVGLCYAMKANPFFVRPAAHAADRLEVCSPGELDICKRAAIDPAKIVYSGVNKLPEDIGDAIDYGCGVLTAESLLHVRYINQVALEKGLVVDVLLRLNAGSQFGMSKEDLVSVVDDLGAWPGIRVVGIHYFVGTQRKKLTHQIKELEKIEAFIDELASEHDFVVERLEYGPGLAVPYFMDDDFSDDLTPLKEMADVLKRVATKAELTIEMGRFFAAPCGAYVTRAMDMKSNKGTNYCILDGGMNHLTYFGQMMGMHVPQIANLSHLDRTVDAGNVAEWCLCGSLCTINDILTRAVELEDFRPGDVLAFFNVGAYSVTEGIHLFLSRTMPRIVVRYDDGSVALVRDFIETSTLNWIQQ